MPLTHTRTLAQRLREGRLPVAEAFRYAMQRAESLRQLHDAGKAHGAFTPANVALIAEGVVLMSAEEESTGESTPYTAPEVVLGSPADARSDIFGFGAVLFEMLTGRRAFDGESRATLEENLTRAATPSSGSMPVDRLLGPCLQKNPLLRSPRMQKVIMELKLLSVAMRRAPSLGGGVQTGAPVAAGSAPAAEAQPLESWLNARLQLHEKAVSEMQRSTGEAVSSLKSQMAALCSELALARRYGERPDRGPDAAAGAEVMARVDRGFEVLNARFAKIECTVEEIRRHHSQFEHRLAADLVDIEHGIKVQSAGVESARTAMAQTDDLVERVVEALESLQTAVTVVQGEEAQHASLTVN